MMTKKRKKGIQRLGGEISNGIRSLYIEQAKWVQTWVVSRALPLIALVALSISFFFMVSRSIFSRQEILIVSISLLIVCLIYLVKKLFNREWIDITGNYNTFMAYLAILLLLSDPSGVHSILFWIAVLIGFYFIGFAYTRAWLIAGEFPLLALVVASISLYSEPFIPKELFIFIAFLPIILILAKMSIYKPMLYLVGLVISSWIYTGIEDWFIIFAIIAIVILIIFVIKAIGNLSEREESSLLKSSGLAIISGLIFLIFVTLLQLSIDRYYTWMYMYVVMLFTFTFIYYKFGFKWLPYLSLWATHWSIFTCFFICNDLFEQAVSQILWIISILLILCGIVLRYLSVKLNYRGLHLWSNIYFITSAISLLMVHSNKDFHSWGRVIFSIMLFSLILYLYKDNKMLIKAAPWWKGVLDARHVVVMRTISKKGESLVASIPVIGITISTFIQSFQVIFRLKRGGETVNSGDIMLLVSIPCIASFYTDFMINYMLTTLPNPALTFWSITLILTGTLFGISGLINREPLYPLLAMVVFLLAPYLALDSDYNLTTFFWISCSLSATGILSLKGLVEDFHLVTIKSNID